MSKDSDTPARKRDISHDSRPKPPYLTRKIAEMILIRTLSILCLVDVYTTGIFGMRMRAEEQRLAKRVSDGVTTMTEDRHREIHANSAC